MFNFYYRYKCRKELGEAFHTIFAGLVAIGNVARYVANVSMENESVAFALAYDSCVQTSYLTRDKFDAAYARIDPKYQDDLLYAAYKRQINKQVIEIERTLSEGR
jgi:hypothetical protein